MIQTFAREHLLCKGSPEGQVYAERGTIAVNSDNGRGYLKSTTEDAATGWTLIPKSVVGVDENPNGIVTGCVGDLYSSTAGTKWTKILGDGDNQGWK